MSTSRDLIKSLNEQTLEQLQRSQDAVVDMVRILNERAPKLPGVEVPIDADRLIDSAFGFAQSVLDLNHRFAHRLLGVSAPEGAAPSAAAAAVEQAAPVVDRVPAGEAPAVPQPPAKKATAKKATAKTAKKAPAKKATAKKAPAESAPAVHEPAEEAPAADDTTG